MLNISKTIRDDDAVFALEGRLDTTTAQDLEHALQKAMPRVSKLTLDFENLDYISSAGLRAISTGSCRYSVYTSGRQLPEHPSAQGVL